MTPKRKGGNLINFQFPREKTAVARQGRTRRRTCSPLAVLLAAHEAAVAATALPTMDPPQQSPPAQYAQDADASAEELERWGESQHHPIPAEFTEYLDASLHTEGELERVRAHVRAHVAAQCDLQDGKVTAAALLLGAVCEGSWRCVGCSVDNHVWERASCRDCGKEPLTCKSLNSLLVALASATDKLRRREELLHLLVYC